MGFGVFVYVGIGEVLSVYLLFDLLDKQLFGLEVKLFKDEVEEQVVVFLYKVIFGLKEGVYVFLGDLY